MLHQGDSSLSPAEKEDQEIEHRMKSIKERPHSRKYRSRRPDRSKRRQRMKIEDSDIQAPVKADPDLSKMAARIVAEPSEDIRGLFNKRVQSIFKALSELSTPLADAFHSEMHEKFIDVWDNTKKQQLLLQEMGEFKDKIKGEVKKYGRILGKAEPAAVARIIADNWPDKSDWQTRAAIIGGIRKAADDSKLPEAIKVPFLRQDIPNVLADNKAIKAILKSNVKKSGADENDLFRFAQLVAAYQVLSKNPDKISTDQLMADVKKLAGSLDEQVSEVVDLNNIMNIWTSALGQIKAKDTNIDYKPNDYDKLLKNLSSFFDQSKYVNPEPTMKEMEKLLKEEFKDIPPEMEAMFKGFKRAATSNETPRIRIMAKKVVDYAKVAGRVATYHGIIDQRGNPTDPINTGWKSYDKRYFGEDNYKSIVKYAKELLTQDWFKYGWGEKKSDASLRAALDVAIYVGDSTLHQSKIDSETYNMLLNRLAGWGYDSFSETIVFESGKGTKRSASMKAEIQNLVRIANDIRQTNPTVAFEMLKNIRGLTAGLGIEPELEPEPPTTSGAKEDISKAIEETISEMSGEEPDKVAQAIADILEKGFEKMRPKSPEDLQTGLEELVEAAGEVMGGQAAVGSTLGYLVRVAYKAPSLRPLILPVVAAAKKGKGKGKAQPKGKGKAPPFGGKKAPPFGKKDEEEKKTAKGKKTSKGKKRRSSITATDLEW